MGDVIKVSPETWRKGADSRSAGAGEKKGEETVDLEEHLIAKLERLMEERQRMVEESESIIKFVKAREGRVVEEITTDFDFGEIQAEILEEESRARALLGRTHGMLRECAEILATIDRLQERRKQSA